MRPLLVASVLVSLLMAGCTAPGCDGEGCETGPVVDPPTGLVDGACVDRSNRHVALEWTVPSGTVSREIAFTVPSDAAHLEAYIQVHRLAAGRFDGILTDPDGKAFGSLVSGGVWTAEQGADTGGSRQVVVDDPAAGAWTLHWSSDGAFSATRVHVRAELCDRSIP